MNYLDLVIILFIAVTMYFGYLRGFIKDFASLAALALALFLASLYYLPTGGLIVRFFGLSAGFASSVGFFVIWFLVEFVYYALLIWLYDKVPVKVRESRLNKWAGMFPASLRAILFIWFTVNLFLLLPFNGFIGNQFRDSLVSKSLTKNNVALGYYLGKTFGPGASDAVNFLTVKPQSSEIIRLGYTTKTVTTDIAAAKQMLADINKQRADRGLSTLVMDDKLSKIADEHCRDMFARGYFSHNTPDGVTPFARMDKAGIIYLVAGENLALAPTEPTAMTGLMNSPAHKANILSADFGKIGISVVDGGIHGEMFAQEFTN